MSRTPTERLGLRGGSEDSDFNGVVVVDDEKNEDGEDCGDGDEREEEEGGVNRGVDDEVNDNGDERN